MEEHHMPADTTDRDPEQLVHRWFEEMFNDGDLPVADEILAPDVAYQGPKSLTPQDVTGPEDIKEYVETFKAAFPDLTYRVEKTRETADGIVVEWSMTGTQSGDLFEMKSRGEAFAEEGINIFSIENGRIDSIRSEWDTLKVVKELGIVSTAGSG